MLSYRHSFHAGNHADVLKHIVLMLIIESLQQKEKGFYYLDTHAGAGRYRLFSAEAEKTLNMWTALGVCGSEKIYRKKWRAMWH